MNQNILNYCAILLLCRTTIPLLLLLIALLSPTGKLKEFFRIQLFNKLSLTSLNDKLGLEEGFRFVVRQHSLGSI